MKSLSLFILFAVFYEAIGAPPVIQKVEKVILDLKNTPIRPLDDEPIDNIVGGDEVDIKQVPYQVSLLRNGSPFCGGSIISNEYILTAAHCLSSANIDTLSVRVGSNFTTEGGMEYKIAKKALHDKYNPPQKDYDVAVLKTSEKISVDGVTTAIVKLPEEGSSMKPGENVVVSGWGLTEESGLPSKVLRAVSVPVVSLEECKKAYKSVTDNMVCAGAPEGGKDACQVTRGRPKKCWLDVVKDDMCQWSNNQGCSRPCEVKKKKPECGPWALSIQGDSGGPAVAEASGLQYGIVSFGRGCARKDYPGVYASVASFRGWIKEASGV